MENKKLYMEAISKFGSGNQKAKFIEEAAELIKEILKNTSQDFIDEEMADVEIMLEQLKLVYMNADAVQRHKIKKLKRLELRLKKI